MCWSNFVYAFLPFNCSYSLKYVLTLVIYTQIAQWIRGSADKNLDKSKDTLESFSCGNHFSHSIETWRTLVRQSWLMGFLKRSLAIGTGHNRRTDIVYAAYTVTTEGVKFLSEDSAQEVLLPDEIRSSEKKEVKLNDNKEQTTPKARKGRGTHILNVAKRLISDKDNWFPIKASTDYNFPGVFDSPYPQRLGYCADISKLPNYESSDPHFLYSDIQIGKGKARTTRKIQMNIDGKDETVYYRFTPCGGVKRCSMHSEGCSYVVSSGTLKLCSRHPEAVLERTSECPVDFFYIWPVDENDNRRWLTGITRSGDLQASDLHNHPHHKESKIPVKVDSDIRRAVLENPNIKSSELLTGMCSDITSRYLCST